jgi:acid phosphatase family membrane protein YuiD
MFQNPALVAAIIGWMLASILKPPIHFLRTRQWNWVLILRAGGMPSSHSAVVSAVAYAVGATAGFNDPSFAVAVALAIVVVYDATGIRRQAGRHAEIINAMIKDLVEGHPLQQEKLRTVLGHSPGEALAGVLLGLAVAQTVLLFWSR